MQAKNRPDKKKGYESRRQTTGAGRHSSPPVKEGDSTCGYLISAEKKGREKEGGATLEGSGRVLGLEWKNRERAILQLEIP